MPQQKFAFLRGQPGSAHENWPTCGSLGPGGPGPDLNRATNHHWWAQLGCSTISLNVVGCRDSNLNLNLKCE